jgi:hypothetical protein
MSRFCSNISRCPGCAPYPSGYARGFGKSGLLSDRFDFEQGMSRPCRSVEALEGSASEAEEQHLERLAQIEEGRVGRSTRAAARWARRRLAEIATLRDGAALTLTDFRAG